MKKKSSQSTPPKIAKTDPPILKRFDELNSPKQLPISGNVWTLTYIYQTRMNQESMKMKLSQVSYV